MAAPDTAAPLVAIATPVYNGGQWLEKAMECVQAQTYPNLIHVVRDNGSKDGTPAVLERFKNLRIPVIVERTETTVPIQKNWSAVAAMVPKEAKYFQILCADDELTPDAVEKMVAVAETDPEIELVGCIRRMNQTPRPTSLPPGVSVFDGRDIVSAYLNKRSNEIPHTYGLYRRHEADFAQDFFDEGLLSCDSDACLRVLARGKFGYVHEPLYMMRLHEDSFTNRVANVNKATVFEPLLAIERWGEKVMSKDEYEACRRRHLRVIYRYMLAWRAQGRTDLYERHLTLLREHGVKPSPLDFVRSTVEWPFLVAARNAARADAA